MVTAPTVVEQSDQLLDALRAVMSTGTFGAATDQVRFIEQLDAIEAACAAAKARVTVGFAQDRMAGALEDIGDRDPGAVIASAQRSLTGELALAHRTSPTTMSRLLSQYRLIVRGMPRVNAAWSRGAVASRVVFAVAAQAADLHADHLAGLDDELAAQIATMTPRRAASAVRKYSVEVDPEAALRRMRGSERKSRVSCRPIADGIAQVSLCAPTAEAVGMYAALRKAAKSSQRADETLGMAMIREAFERITGLTRVEDIGIEINLVMSDLALFTGEGEPARMSDPDQSVDDCWLPPDVAHHLATTYRNADGTVPRWIRRLYADPVSGTLDDVDTRRREFTDAQRRFIKLRDQHCSTPWCDAPIRDIDHAKRYTDGGETTTVNGSGTCQRCNLTRNHVGWKTTAVAARFGQPHAIIARTPTGRTYRSKAPPVLGKPKPPPYERDFVVRLSHAVDLGLDL